MQLNTFIYIAICIFVDSSQAPLTVNEISFVHIIVAEAHDSYTIFLVIFPFTSVAESFLGYEIKKIIVQLPASIDMYVGAFALHLSINKIALLFVCFFNME
jgi:hypothetical protein